MLHAGHTRKSRCLFSCPGVPCGTVFDDFGAPFPRILTDFGLILDGFLSMMLDDFLANLSHAQELNFIDLLFILDGRLMILEDFVMAFLICLHNKDLRAPHWHPLFIDSGINF